MKTRLLALLLIFLTLIQPAVAGVTVTGKTITISNGGANDGTTVNTMFSDVYTNDSTLASYINSNMPLLGGTNTFSGANTYNSSLTVSGILNILRASDPSTAEGLLWGNSTDHLLKYYDGTATRPVATDNGVNAQTGTSYTLVAADRNKLVTFSNASAQAVTVPQAGTTGFASNYKTTLMSLGAGTVTITPTTSTIDGAASITLTQNQSITVYSDGTNYFTSRGRSIAPALILLAFASASSSSTIDFTSSINSTYDHYVIEIEDLVPGTDDVDFWMRVSEDAGGSWKSGGTDYAYEQIIGGSRIASTGAAQVLLTFSSAGLKLGNTSADNSAYRVDIYSPAGTGHSKIFKIDGPQAQGTATQTNSIVSQYKGTTNAITGIRFLTSSGNIASGKFYLYGVAKQ